MAVSVAQKTWYVYLLCDPDTEVPFYVGKGTGDRAKHHERSIDSPHDTTNPAKKDEIRRIHAEGKRVLIKKVASFQDEVDAYIYEWATINLYHEHLTNIEVAGGRQSRPLSPSEIEREGKIYLTPEAATKFLGISRKTLDRWAKDGKVKRYQRGIMRGVFYKQSELEQLNEMQPYEEGQDDRS